MLNINISIGEIETEMTTDSDLHFDAIESLLNRAVVSTLNIYMALPPKDRMASLGLETEDEFDDEELEDED
jgi:hypothetical protein